MAELGKFHQQGFTLSHTIWDLNGHKLDPRASPEARIWSKSSYHIPEGFAMSKGAKFKLN